MCPSTAHLPRGGYILHLYAVEVEEEGGLRWGYVQREVNRKLDFRVQCGGGAVFLV